MEKLIISKTKVSPEIKLEIDGKIEIIGESYPENAMGFYTPIIDWIKKAIAEKIIIQNTFRLDYFNTSTFKCIVDILDLYEGYHKNGGKVKVLWYHKKDDDDMMEAGKEFLEDMTFPNEVIAYD